MDIDWVAPFRIAFELFMFVIGWGLVALIAFAAIGFVWALIAAISKTAKKAREDKARDSVKKMFK